MLNNTLLKDMANRIAAILPMAEELEGEARSKIEQKLQKTFADMDLLSREEFEAQANALQRAEKRVEDLQTTIAELEKRLDGIEQSLAKD